MFLVFDIGRTNLRAAVYDDGTNTLHNIRRTQTPGNLPEALRTMQDLGNHVLGGTAAGKVAIGFPGPVAASGDLPTASVEIDGSKGKDFSTVARTLWPGAKVWLMNDVTAAGYHFVQQGHTNFVVTNVGSNIGQKVFLQGRPVIGARGRGGEIGHLVVDEAPDAPVCDCGGRGHLSAISSGRGTLALAIRQASYDPVQYHRASLSGRYPIPGTMDTNALLQAFHSGDPWAARMIHEAARPLAGTMAALHLALGLENFFVTGGFAAAAGPAYGRILADEAGRRAGNLRQDWTRMIADIPANDDVGLSGAVYAAKLQQSSGALGVVPLA